MKRYVLTLVIIGMLSELIEGTDCDCTPKHPQTSLCHSDFGTYCYTNITTSLWFPCVLVHKHHYVTLILVCIATQTSLCHSCFDTHCYTNVTMSFWFLYALLHKTSLCHWFRYVLLHKRHYVTLSSVRIATQTSLCHSDFDTHCYINVTMSLWFRYALLHKRHYVILILVRIATQNITMSLWFRYVLLLKRHYVTLISTWLLHKRHYVSLISAHIAAQTSLCHSDVRLYSCTDVIMSLWFRYVYCNTSVIMPLWFQCVLLHKVRCVTLILVRILLHIRHYITDSVRNCYTNVNMSLIPYVIVTQTSVCHWFRTHSYRNAIMSIRFWYVLLHNLHYVIDQVRIVTKTSLCHGSSTYRYKIFIMSLI
jgi:hypothetical protein